MRIYGGSYERFLFGFEVSRDDGVLGLEQVLSIPAHKSAVKCMEIAGNVVVTGGADDQLHLFNMHSNTDLGFLVNPAEGPVPCVAFASTPESKQPSLLLSGSVGGDICVWRAEGYWEHVKGMKGHRDIVSSMSAHPSGKLALSVSRDKQMRLWDLTKGSCAYQAALGAAGDLVGFFSSGDMYYVSSSDPSTPQGSKVSLHSIQGHTVATIDPNRKVVSVSTQGEHTLVAGCEGGHIMTWDIRKPSECMFSLDKAHKSRIRGLTAPFDLSSAVLGSNGDSQVTGSGTSTNSTTCMASASSDGVVKVWSMSTLSGATQSQVALAEVDAQARFTCLCVFDEQRRKGRRAKEGHAEKNADMVSVGAGVGAADGGSSGGGAAGALNSLKKNRAGKDVSGSPGEGAAVLNQSTGDVKRGSATEAAAACAQGAREGGARERGVVSNQQKKKGGKTKKKHAAEQSKESHDVDVAVARMHTSSGKGSGAVKKKGKKDGKKRKPQA